jgi:hypothetical protein
VTDLHCKKLGNCIDIADNECKRFLTAYVPESYSSVVEQSIRVIANRVIDVMKEMHSGCDHKLRPLVVMMGDQKIPTVYLDPVGDWVVLEQTPNGLRPRKISIADLAMVGVNHMDLVRGIRRQLHFMSLEATSTQGKAQA